MKKLAVVFTVILLFACNVKRPPTAAPRDNFRRSITTLYVGIPTMSVYAEPREDAAVIATYEYQESTSVLAQKGGWYEVRTFDGASGWARSMDLLTAEQIDPFLKDPKPRIYLPPQPVPAPGVRGEVVLEAKVDPSGNVFDVTVVRNTTRLDELALTNADALRKAKFFPLINNHQRASFRYEYVVSYPLAPPPATPAS
jgi:TonB family protein